ncbi:macro domain-containing protein [candidate division KSB1 bacterium]
MTEKLTINRSTLRLEKGDITDTEVEAFVYYARNDLVLWSGYGTAVSIRGGPSVQEELDKLGPQETTSAVITTAGEMKATYIIHAVGPKFQEQNIPEKLRKTIENVLESADKKGIKQIAFPPMGTGFYCIPLDVSAEIVLGTITDYLMGDTRIEDVVIMLLDSREYNPYHDKLSALEQV